MTAAILINLDYEGAPYEACKLLWVEIREKMLNAGFKYDGRLFTIENLEERQAFALARAVMESIEEHLEFEERRLHKFLKSFYGYKYAKVVNLLTPCPKDSKVEKTGSELVSG